jgi:hypothetical protein
LGEGMSTGTGIHQSEVSYMCLQWALDKLDCIKASEMRGKARSIIKIFNDINTGGFLFNHTYFRILFLL